MLADFVGGYFVSNILFRVYLSQAIGSQSNVSDMSYLTVILVLPSNEPFLSHPTMAYSIRHSILDTQHCID